MIHSRAIVALFLYIKLKEDLRKDWRLVGAKKKFHEYEWRENETINPAMKNVGEGHISLLRYS